MSLLLNQTLSLGLSLQPVSPVLNHAPSVRLTNAGSCSPTGLKLETPGASPDNLLFFNKLVRSG